MVDPNQNFIFIDQNQLNQNNNQQMFQYMNNQNQINQNNNQQMFQFMNPNQLMMNNNNNNQFNMVQNFDFFNNMFLMHQNQMFQGMMHQMNYANNNLNANFCNNNNNSLRITPNQQYLIDYLISFYKKNGNDYMDYSNPTQIQNILNLLDPNYPELKYENMHQIHDPLYYIKGPKTVIKFINSDYIIYKVRIPKTINKFDLHSIAQFYKHDKTLYSNIILIYKNNILD